MNAIFNLSKIHLIILSSLFLFSCSNKGKIEIKEFNPLSNFNVQNDTLHLDINLDNTIVDGIHIPSKNNTADYFLIQFKIKNNYQTPKHFYYKVFYQNETYKFNEMAKSLLGYKETENADLNFYGSWNTNNMTFHKTKLIPNDGNYHVVTDTIKIIGNPRNEKKYFGGKVKNSVITKNQIESIINSIKNSEEWFNSIKAKAKENNNRIEDQLYDDAIWLIKDKRRKGNYNNRWQRNPRVGTYSFLLSVVDENSIDQIPYYYQNITLRDTTINKYRNPFFYFLHDKKAKKVAYSTISNNKLKVKTKIDVAKGVYADPKQPLYKLNLSDTGSLCGYSDNLFRNAHLMQFIHFIDKNYNLNNVPVSHDVVGDNYTQKQYHENADKFKPNELIKDFVKVSTSPGTTVGYDSMENAAFMINPGNTNSDNFAKENVGLITRHGFTYGKFTAKIKFPEIISKDHVWNGLTCAFWLLYQEGDWNDRNVCNSGYIPKHLSGKSEKERVNSNTYSEIDIEIVKASKYWPKTSYSDSTIYKADNALNDNVIVSCTNWDLACRDPKDFNTGVREFKYHNNTFQLHRWDDWYKALTSKYESKQNETLGKIMYFQIEWLPNEIIWRMGPDKSNMKVIGYMNSDHTKIPNNQMVAVVTQEFHDASWWPTAPFSQNNVPFPLNDIKGYLYEIEIE